MARRRRGSAGVEQAAEGQHLAEHARGLRQRQRRAGLRGSPARRPAPGGRRGPARAPASSRRAACRGSSAAGRDARTARSGARMRRSPCRAQRRVDPGLGRRTAAHAASSGLKRAIAPSTRSRASAQAIVLSSSSGSGALRSQCCSFGKPSHFAFMRSSDARGAGSYRTHRGDQRVHHLVLHHVGAVAGRPGADSGATCRRSPCPSPACW